MIYELSTDAVMAAVLIVSSLVVFGPASLTTLGWAVYGLAFAGSGAHIGCRLLAGGQSLFEKFKSSRDEKNNLKPNTAAA